MRLTVYPAVCSPIGAEMKAGGNEGWEDGEHAARHTRRMRNIRLMHNNDNTTQSAMVPQEPS